MTILLTDNEIAELVKIAGKEKTPDFDPCKDCPNYSPERLTMCHCILGSKFTY